MLEMCIRDRVNRYFKEGDTSFVEISLEEYKEREAMDAARVEKLAKEQDGSENKI